MAKVRYNLNLINKVHLYLPDLDGIRYIFLFFFIHVYIKKKKHCDSQ